MNKRKCVYTGKDANCKDKVIPHDGGDINYNWANSVPCNIKYKDIKSGNHPTEIEFQIGRAFIREEMAKQEVDFWIKEGVRLRFELSQNLKKVSKSDTLGTKELLKSALSKKDKEIKQAYKQKEIIEMDLTPIIEKKKNKKVEW